MDFSDYIINVFPIYFLELLAALAGIYYLKRTKEVKKRDKYLVYFLWFTLFVEVIGGYAPLAYFSEYKYLPFIENTVFKDNNWVYNISSIVSYLFFVFYFRDNLKNKLRKNILKIASMFFFISSVFYIFYFKVFFNEFSKYTVIVGTLLIFISVIFYYFELLKSDTILKIKKMLPFYISVGTLVFHLCVTPIDIFSEHFKAGNDLFNALQVNILLYANVFMYSMFIIGFIVCLEKKSY